MSREKRSAIYGMLRNHPKDETKNARMKPHPDTCPMCGRLTWKTTLADIIVNNGGRALCTKCAMNTAWGE